MEENKKSKGPKVLIVVLIVLGVLMVGMLALGLILGFYYWNESKEEPLAVEEVAEEIINEVRTPKAEASNFATWKEKELDYTPQVPAYTVDKDLGNVENADLVDGFSQEATKMLAENAFIVVNGFSDEFFTLYDANRYNYTPSFIASDSVLHNYHLYFNYLLEKVEKEHLVKAAGNLTDEMIAKSKKQIEELKGTDWEGQAVKNLAFFSVGKKLLDPDYSVDPQVKEIVDQELELINAHNGITESPLWGNGLREDYSQYIPRGHYDKSEELKRYFKAMMWYGRMTFRFKQEDEARGAALATKIMYDADIRELWDSIYEPTNFFVGKADDISYYQVKPVMDKIYGPDATVTDLTDSAKFDQYWSEVKKLDPPEINSIPVLGVTAGGNPDLDEEIAGFRFMGQRYTIDADIFQNLICRQVGNKDGTKDCPKEGLSRMLPNNLDIPAGMGSEEAYGILDKMGETEYLNYPENMTSLQEYIDGLDQATWTQNLYWGWMYALRPLLQEPGQGYPSFMTNNAWFRKQLNTYISSWTELKHDTILYAKQVYAELGAGAPKEKDDRGYVEPVPEVYNRLSSLILLTEEGLDVRGLIASKDKENLERFNELVTSLRDISVKELENEDLTDKEYDLIRSYGGSLEHLWLETFSEEERKDKTTEDLLNDNPAALITDVATDPNGSVLEEATGRINQIYVVFPMDGQLRIGKGGVYSQYEFMVPLADRMTDTKWRNKLDNFEDVPPYAEWQAEFLVEDPYNP
ncbi:DUF3160 domain-containing protein [Patescibacteria group bacterium]|nr:DUF3160 domain-containing protein [Patescibacteria group bacterium]MBU1673058.1 DUF3160 domain-containing protein [Patescibacteria group bacterium]MBU1963664.1 DUF3160 domain-containing protein [Patescibacteria group bacterium]